MEKNRIQLSYKWNRINLSLEVKIFVNKYWKLIFFDSILNTGGLVNYRVELDKVQSMIQIIFF